MYKVNAWHGSGVFIVNFEHISSVSIVNFEYVNADWEVRLRGFSNDRSIFLKNTSSGCV